MSTYWCNVQGTNTVNAIGNTFLPKCYVDGVLNAEFVSSIIMVHLQWLGVIAKMPKTVAVFPLVLWSVSRHIEFKLFCFCITQRTRVSTDVVRGVFRTQNLPL
jgi:hypothetical protein